MSASVEDVKMRLVVIISLYFLLNIKYSSLAMVIHLAFVLG